MATTTSEIISSFPLLEPVKAKGVCKFTPTLPSRVSMQCVSFDGKRRITHSNRAQSASIVCSAGQTQTVTSKSHTATHVPGKEKSPQLSDGGGGFPPHDDNGGGGGGGGGENFSGGFFLFGVLAFLGFLKELDKDDKRDRRR